MKLDIRLTYRRVGPFIAKRELFTGLQKMELHLSWRLSSLHSLFLLDYVTVWAVPMFLPWEPFLPSSHRPQAQLPQAGRHAPPAERGPERGCLKPLFLVGFPMEMSPMVLVFPCSVKCLTDASIYSFNPFPRGCTSTLNL